MVEQLGWNRNGVTMEWNSHGGTVIVEQSWWSNHGGTVIVEQSWWNGLGGTVIVEQ